MNIGDAPDLGAGISDAPCARVPGRFRIRLPLRHQRPDV